MPWHIQPNTHVLQRFLGARLGSWDVHSPGVTLYRRPIPGPGPRRSVCRFPLAQLMHSCGEGSTPDRMHVANVIVAHPYLPLRDHCKASLLASNIKPYSQRPIHRTESAAGCLKQASVIEDVGPGWLHSPLLRTRRFHSCCICHIRVCVWRLVVAQTMRQ